MLELGASSAHCEAAQRPQHAAHFPAAAHNSSTQGSSSEGQRHQQARAEQEQQPRSRQRHGARPGFDASPTVLAAKHPGDVAALRALALALWEDQARDPEVLANVSALVIASAAEADCGTEGGCDAAAAQDGSQGKRSDDEAAEAAAQAAAEAAAARGQCLPPRFSDAELMRFAILSGYARARNDEERAAALVRAAEQVVRTAAWLQHHSFASDAELQRFRHLIYWGQPDDEGRPVLHIRLAAAVQHCKGPEAVHFANAIITHMERAVRERLSDAGPQQLNVVMDCGGGSTLAAARISWVFKAVSLTLNHHYPTRLHSLDLVDLPVMLQWLVAAVKKLVQAETRDKIRATTSAFAGGV